VNEIRRAAARRQIVPAMLVVAGIVVLIVWSTFLGSLLIGVGLTLAVALAFYEVGLSEDRERAREEAAAARPERPARARRLPGRRRRPS
jgi:hypothetical protein